MADCKQQILQSIPNKRCCSNAFFTTILASCAQLDKKSNYIIVNAKQDIITKLSKIVKSLYPEIVINIWGEFLVFSGNLTDLQADLRTDNQGHYCLTKYSNNCCQLTTLKSLFLTNGNFYYTKDTNNNSTGYSFEFSVKKENKEYIQDILNSFGFNMRVIERANSTTFYTKNSSLICDILVQLGASYSALDIQSNLAIREMRNSINRQNNCYESNLEKTLNASTEQVDAINYLIETNNLDILEDSLKEVAFVRLANPDVSLNELRTLLGCNISRAGIKYRLDKIITIYKKLKGEN